MNEYKIIAKGVPGYIVIKAESEEAAMLCAQMSGLKVRAMISIPKAESLEKDSDPETEKRDAAIMAWCILDDIWGRLERRRIKQGDTICDTFQTEIDTARYKVMQQCGIDDYEEMTQFVKDSGVAKWDETQNSWIWKKGDAA